MKEPVVHIKDLDFSQGKTKILEKVNLTVNELDSLCVVGPNGGGKTTLIRLILGLLKPDCGVIKLFGRNPEDTRARVGYVPQHANYDPLFPVTVMEVVLMGRLGKSFSGRYSRSDKEAASAALAEMQLSETAGRPFADLSGGQRQRVLIARALASDSRMLILDEPTANIDTQVESHLFEILLELNKRMTILMVTHDLGFASQFFNSVICVNRQVAIHATCEVTGAIIQELYGSEISMIRHDHSCSEGGHQHDRISRCLK